MKLKIFLLCLTVVLAEGSWAKTSRTLKVRYPVAKLVVGSVFLIDNSITLEQREAQIEELKKALLSGKVIKDKAQLRVGDKSSLDLMLGEDVHLVVMENSEVEIPGVAWEDGAILEIKLKKGKIRYRCAEDCHRKLITPLYEDVLSDGDFILSYDAEKPSVELSVLSGQASFRGLENESELSLKAGEKAQFLGVMESGEPAFDVLLKGRKVARGKMGEIQKIDASELEFWKKRDQTVKKKAAEVAKAQVIKKKASQICEAPLGELNQCAWQCVKNPKNAKECLVEKGALCVRTRCNANGSWADRIELPSSNNKCGIRTIVDRCDY